MIQRTFVKRVATLVAGALLFAQLAVAAYACPLAPRASSAADQAGAPTATAPSAAMPDCSDSMGAMDPAAPNLCAEHCKQGQQSDRAQLGVTVPPALLNVLYATPEVPEPAQPRPQAAAWQSALVAASPPHTLAHCVLRI